MTASHKTRLKLKLKQAAKNNTTRLSMLIETQLLLDWVIQLWN